ncbi:DUF4296 domain-containing protein [Rhodohalobacter sp.]|uniref:DUF4296 domain-containing protein n=1 Tax=Rhodohalobacter sp. TaxID=1974210 RepID=UPI002ACDCEEE|nr:DUF4296 domain-containing protein [Rhodohalobacter sp.]MDZ7757886.1 DUF4296 domain-containing protein [Rhodohalobacter sp.]
MKNYLTFALVSLFFLTFNACEKEPELVDEELYKTIMTELAILNQMDQDLLGERDKSDLREEIFVSYGVEEEKFNRSHEIYQSDIEAQMERVKDIQDRLKTERDSIQAAERRYKDETKLGPEEIREQVRNRNKESN